MRWLASNRHLWRRSVAITCCTWQVKEPHVGRSRSQRITSSRLLIDFTWQSKGNLGKSFEAEFRTAWLHKLGVPWNGSDLDDRHHNAESWIMPSSRGVIPQKLRRLPHFSFLRLGIIRTTHVNKCSRLRGYAGSECGAFSRNSEHWTCCHLRNSGIRLTEPWQDNAE